MNLNCRAAIIFNQDNKDYIIKKGDKIKVLAKIICGDFEVIEGIVKAIDTAEMGSMTINGKLPESEYQDEREEYDDIEFDYSEVKEIYYHEQM